MNQPSPESGLNQTEIKEASELGASIEEQSVVLAGLSREISSNTQELPVDGELNLIIDRLRLEGVNISLKQAKKNDRWRRKISHLASINMDLADVHYMSPVNGPVVIEDIKNPKDKRRYEKNLEKMKEYKGKLYTRDDLLRDKAMEELAQRSSAQGNTERVNPESTLDLVEQNNDATNESIGSTDNERTLQEQIPSIQELRERINSHIADAQREGSRESFDKLDQKAKMAVAVGVLTSHDRGRFNDEAFIEDFVTRFMHNGEQYADLDKPALFEKIDAEVQESGINLENPVDTHYALKIIITKCLVSFPPEEREQLSNELFMRLANQRLDKVLPAQPEQTTDLPSESKEEVQPQAPKPSDLSARLAAARREAAQQQVVQGEAKQEYTEEQLRQVDKEIGKKLSLYIRTYADSTSDEQQAEDKAEIRRKVVRQHFGADLSNAEVASILKRARDLRER